MDSLEKIESEIVQCRKCSRLVRWREKMASEKRAAYADWGYWGRPLPGFGDPQAELVVVGLAPAAHGGNRTGQHECQRRESADEDVLARKCSHATGLPK